ncbi:helix-turn-helix transcriptional regulator [Streptomyces alboniger]|uniref:Helix-turn-helix transcriptional regulator n=1 Tax=Streptomyces alboniger TaxID=132473 RepID=A0A5J6HKB8_STRAD|nr:helix-turn-helix transcriptional regulator [Streptomyces alboniger]QEV20759.1 helix-turn-helix transcriptional regulator [Streptomyces alboniger]
MLVYRGEEAARLREFLEADPRTGRPGPRLAVISGAAGMGKTELLHTIAEFAAANRVTVVSAVAAPTEQDLPYAVLEQLQQGVPAEPGPKPGQEQEHRTDPPGRPEAAAPSAPAAPASQVPLRVLSELTRGFGAPAAAGRVLITVDDIQFADAQSRQVLEYLLRNSGFSGLSVVVTEGPAPTGEAFCADAAPEAGRVLRMRLGPLGVEDVGRLLADQLPAAEATHLAPDFHRATGGNPMLLKALAADQLLPSAARRGGGTPQAGDLFRQAALRCAQRSGDYALAVARGLALLREPPTSPNVSLLLSVEDRTIRSAAAALEDAGILCGRRFRHEAMGEAVLDDLSTEEAARLHYCAAKLLHQSGADPVRVATQLLAQDLRGPVDEAWVWEVLQEAARQAPAGGEPDFAVRCLQMAERCCRDEPTRLSIRAQLAELNWGHQPATAAQQVRSLALPARDGRLPISYTLRLVPKLMWYGYVDEATAALRLASTTAAETHAPRLDDEVRATRLQVAGTYPDALTENDRAPYAEQRPEREAATASVSTAATESAATETTATAPMLTKPTPTKSTESHPAPTALSPTASAPTASASTASASTASAPTKPAPGAAARARVRVFGALNSVLGLRSESTAVADAEQILRSTMLTETTVEMLLAALGALILSDLLASSARWCDRLLGQARGKRALAMLMAIRAHIFLRQGNLTAAVERAEASLARLPAHGWGVGIGLPLSALVEARTRMGHHEAAAELLERPVPDAMFRTRYGLSYLHARAALQLQTGRHHAALADFMRCGELMMAWGMDSPALVPWRTGAAQTWLRLQDSERAAALVEDELSRTHPKHLRTRGAALRVLAATRPLPQRPALLEEAVRLLRDAGDSYTMALAMTDLGHAYKRLGAPAKGRGLVRQAGQMADICGAYEPFRAPQPVAARVAPARVAPAGPGALPEGPEPTSGAGIRAEEALTEAERRVARLAALGHTNREISSKLFITVSTVEQHLTRVYRKINIRRRQDLPTTLDFDVADCA